MISLLPVDSKKISKKSNTKRMTLQWPFGRILWTQNA
jgi:hypothetical protein